MRRTRKDQSLAALALVGALAGILIWSKLRLATDLPRTAYAVPEEEPGATRHPPRALSLDSDADSIPDPRP